MNINFFNGMGRTIIIKVALLIAGFFLGFMMIRIFFFPFIISDDTMQPNFNKGERIYLQRFFTPKFGDVVLYENPRGNDDAYLGRVVALEGDTVEVHKGEIKINGIKIQFAWNVMRKDERILPMDFSMRDFFPLIKLKRNEYFVLSDNLDRAMDSRFFGPLQRKQMKGKYFYTFPFRK